MINLLYLLRARMTNKVENKKLLSDLMNLFDRLKVEDSPNQPIANAIGILNEPLIRQIADGIHQQITKLAGCPIQVFENDTQLTHLITSSGGHKKTLYILLQNTFLYSREEFPVSQRAIGTARGNLKYILNNSIDADKWHLLANVHREPYGDYSRPEYSALPIWSVLRYEDANVAWHRVHPLLTETVGFREAIETVV